MKKKKEIQVVKAKLELPTHLCFKQIHRQALETSKANHSGRQLLTEISERFAVKLLSIVGDQHS